MEDETTTDMQDLGKSLTACKAAEFIRYDEEVEQAIQEVCPPSGPLDEPKFNVVEYINRLFPTEQSLSSIDDTVIRYRSKLGELDRDIRDIIRRQSDSGYDGRQALEDAEKTIEVLFARIKNIREKAERTEQTVQEITQGIKRLDTAKKNLTTSITTLQQLKMVVTSLKDLQRSTEDRQYAAAADQLRVIVNIMESFQKYRHIDKVQELETRVYEIRDKLSQQIKDDFVKAFTTDGAGPRIKANLAAACTVVDVIGARLRNDIIHWFVDLQMSHYRADFDFTQEHAWLDKVDRRYAWLKRTLVIYTEDCGTIFPMEWGVPERLCVQFCEMTKRQLTQQMQARPTEVEVKLLLYAIQKTSTFEKALAQKYTPDTSAYIKSITPPPAPRKRLSDDFDDVEPAEPPIHREENSVFVGMISKCFEPYLGVYIQSQDKNLAELLDSFVKDFKKQCSSQSETGDPMLASSMVLPNSADLFMFYKKCLVQCISLSTGEPLLKLTALFQKYLDDYSERVLTANIPKFATAAPTTTSRLHLGFLRSDESPPEIKLSADEIVLMCTLVCTADYCVDTTQQLESKLKEKIDEELIPKVTFNAQLDRLHGVISNCIHLWVQSVMTPCQAALTAMTKTSWQSVEGVGDHSSYVTTIKTHLESIVPLLRENLSSCRKYFINFCHKLADAFIPNFVSHLYKCRQVTTFAAEQLLLDTSQVKRILTDLPSTAQVIQRKPPASYAKIVQNGMDRAELLLKVVMAPHSIAEAFVGNYINLMKGDSDVASFQRVLEMKVRENVCVCFRESWCHVDVVRENMCVCVF
jgi:hypothetical protein